MKNFKAGSGFLLAVLFLAGCFGENPVKTGPLSSEERAQRTLDSAQALMNRQKFAEAMACFERAIALDSNLSQAYSGYAQATAFHYAIDVGDILEDMHALSAGNSAALLARPDSVHTRRLQASRRITRVLDALVNRDTLSTAANPLTDGKVTFEDVMPAFGIYKLIHVLESACDVDANGVFDSTDRRFAEILLGGSGDLGGLGGLGDLSEEMRMDTALQQDVNQEILELQNGLADLNGLLAGFNGGNPDTSGASYEGMNLLDSAVANLGETLQFYQFGDRKDNDGDGCVDEEIIDSLDNDLDGFVDEDARVITGTGAAGSPGDGVDNDHNGKMDAADAGENKVGGFTQAKDLLGFVARSGHGENWVKIRKSSVNMDVRLRIQKDSLALPSRASRPGYAAKIDSAAALVGGCWPMYQVVEITFPGP